LPPGLGWYHGKRAQVAESDCWGSASGGITYLRTLLIHGARSGPCWPTSGRTDQGLRVSPR